MLVLSRRPEEKILLPTVPALIKIISAQTGLARVGIEAPSHVPILREELTHDRPYHSSITPPGDPTDQPSPEDVQQRIKSLLLAITMLRAHVADRSRDVRRLLDSMEEEVLSLNQHLEHQARSGQTPDPIPVGTV